MFQNLTNENAELLLKIMVMDKDPSFSLDGIEIPVACAIIQKRIEAFKLPIAFTPCALLSASIFCDSPGQTVVFLIDCLQRFENQTVTLSQICTDLYPFGFYTQDAFEEYLDVKIKNKEVKFWFIY